jgi:hypothetical protein
MRPELAVWKGRDDGVFFVQVVSVSLSDQRQDFPSQDQVVLCGKLAGLPKRVGSSGSQ